MPSKSKQPDLGRLCHAIQRARLALREPRERRRDMVEAFAGANWGADRIQRTQPVNLLGQYVSIISRGLVAKAPRVQLTTFHRPSKPTVHAMQDWMNQQIVDLRLANTFQRSVTDALFCLGIIKVGICSPADAAMTGWYAQAGGAFVERIDFDDFVYDVHARDFKECQFSGHRYRAPLDVVREFKEFSKRRKELTASEDRQQNPEGDQKIQALARGEWAGDPVEFEEMVDLWEIWLPRHGLIVTLDADQVSGGGADESLDDALRVQPYIGHPCGPYHILGFGVVPGNALYKAPVQDLFDLHMFANESFRKIMRQAKRQKEVLPVKGTQEEDMKRLEEADDGCAYRSDYDAPKPVNYGGPNQGVLAAFLQAKMLFNELGGNLALLGGTAPQSPTAKQDEMLNANAGGGVADKQDAALAHVADVLEALAWLWWHDPQKVMRVSHAAPGLPEVAITRSITPADRQQAAWEDLKLRVDPYSLRHSTPQQRLAMVNQLVQQVILPIMPLLQQQGISLDLNRFLEINGEYGDLPELAEIITLRDPPQVSETPGGGDQPPKPGQTERTYNRVSTSERTPQGTEQSMVAQLATGNDQGGSPQMAGMMGAA